jgi:hypothetical protein
MTDTNTADRDTHGKLDQTRDAAGRVYERTVDSATAAIDQTRTTAAQTIEANPLGILAGGLALGALAGALVPRSDKEKELLAPLGRQLGERIRAATQAARSAGQEEFANLGLTKDGAKDQVKTLFDGVAKAVSTAGSAAAKTAAKKP